MHELVKLARGNPVPVLIVAGLAGWALGSGLLPNPLAALGGGLRGHATTAAAPGPTPVPAGTPGTLPTSSASMPAPAVAPPDPFAGFSL